ncbi:hypothetical protein Bca101_046683 [Brassica carinata]
MSLGKLVTNSASSVLQSDRLRNNVVKEITFKDVTFGTHEGAGTIPLIHSGGLEPPDEDAIGPRCSSSIVRHGDPGFIPQGRIEVYCVTESWCSYRLNSFFGSKSKPIYRLQIPATICFSWNSFLSYRRELCPLSDDRYRVHGYEEFDAACDLRGQLYDYVGHIKLRMGRFGDGLRLDESEIAASRRLISMFRPMTSEFCEKFNASEGTARVILVTTLNPKRFGVLTLSSMAPSRVFLDNDVEETRVYLSWLNSNLDVASRVNAEVITKPEPATLGELFSYMKKATAKVAWFECTATIDAVVHGSEWLRLLVWHMKWFAVGYTLLCCIVIDVSLKQLISRLSVYDHNDQGVFVLLGDAGEELTGKKAGELVEGYYQANEGEEVDEEPDGGSETRGEEAVKRGTDVSVRDGVKRARCG